jgi:hypothetical protein
LPGPKSNLKSVFGDAITGLEGEVLPHPQRNKIIKHDKGLIFRIIGLSLKTFCLSRRAQSSIHVETQNFASLHISAGKSFIPCAEFDRHAEIVFLYGDTTAAFTDKFRILYQCVILFRVGLMQSFAGQFA